MEKRILVPIDGSSQSDAALDYALDTFDDADVTVLHVIDPITAGHGAPVGIPDSSEEWYESAREESEEFFERARETADEYGVTLDTAEEVGRPATTIVQFADDHDFDAIVMGSHGRSGISRILLGSVAETVVRRASVPVTVVR